MDLTLRKSGPPCTIEQVFDGMTIRGRNFTPEELLQIKAVVEESPESHRFSISKKVCEALGWRQRNGRLKDRACRDVLARLHDIGFLRLPAPRRPAVRRQPITITDRVSRDSRGIPRSSMYSSLSVPGWSMRISLMLTADDAMPAKASAPATRTNKGKTEIRENLMVPLPRLTRDHPDRHTTSGLLRAEMAPLAGYWNFLYWSVSQRGDKFNDSFLTTLWNSSISSPLDR